MDAFVRELRQALRALRRELGFTSVALLTLAIGVGATTLFFAVVRAILLEPLPYHAPERLVMLWTTSPERGVLESPSALADIQDWQAESRSLEQIATFDHVSLTVGGGEWPEQIPAATVSANLFPLLGVAPAMGRTFSPEEERARARVMVVSDELSRARFGDPRNALGRTIDIAGTAFEIIGVMPGDFAFPERTTRLWLPRTHFTDWETASARRGVDSWRVVARLRPTISIGEARAEMSAIAERLEEAHPATNTGLGVAVVPLHEQVTGQSLRVALWTLFGAVAFLYVIASANLAHLALVRAMGRARERAVRAALGATAPRLIRESLVESVVLSVAGAVAGLLLAWGGLRILLSLAPANLPRLHEVDVGPGVIAYGAVAALVAGVLSGIAPALAHSSAMAGDLLRDRHGASPRTRWYRARRLLVAGQLALAIVLVFGATLLVRSLVEASSVDPGFRTENVLMANLSVAEPSRRQGVYEQVLEEVRAIPGVRSAAIVEDLFISGAPSRSIVIQERASEGPSFERIRIDAIAGDLLGALDVPLRAGRQLAPSDDAASASVAIINEAMARRFWPEGSAVGRRFRLDDLSTDAPWIEVVGMIGDLRRQGRETAPIPQMFVPYSLAPSRNMVLLVRTERSAPDLLTALRRRVAEIDPTVPVYRATTLTRALDDQLLERRSQSLILSLFSAVALVLAAIGLYGLIQYQVTQRTHEIGVRIAIGAASSRVVLMILRQGLAVALPGLVAGILGALWVSELISALLFGVSATDVASVAATAGVLLLTTLVACLIPARRAAAVDPVSALRHR